MNEINRINLSEQTKFRLSGIGEKLSKYVTTFDYIDKILIVLSAPSNGVCIISSAGVVGATVGIVSARFTLIFSLTTGMIKKLLSITRNKHDKIHMLA